jgi:hypothetical protein
MNDQHPLRRRQRDTGHGKKQDNHADKEPNCHTANTNPNAGGGKAMSGMNDRAQA